MKRKPTKAKIDVRGTKITVIRRDDEDYISLTDIAKSKNPDHPDDLIRNWLRNRNTLELLGIWEQLHNRAFNPVEFDGIKKRAGLNSFTLTSTEAPQRHRRPPDADAHRTERKAIGGWDGMKAEELKPQITQMNADSDILENICANLRNLRITHSREQETDKGLKQILGRTWV